MGKINVFNFITLNGFYKGHGGDISWHRHGGEENEFSEEGANSGSILLFGRVTYEMMAGYWPSPMAKQNSPVVAEGMNKAQKIVISTTLKKANWENTRIISENVIEEITRLKNSTDSMITILGSGSIITLLADHCLIDTYQFMIDPVALGEGTPVFDGLKKKLDLELTGSRVFKSGVVLLNYRPLK
ncbi:MAG: dihydrofolate reductase family protein [Saprospiraceae bacterium]|uniref:Dihydrofolate reductase family protein n=1 Tax=Candidatus Opimibacter skivensis TaxID=2982028 RepID=A0A9D7SRA1_9BACT|nr:dihydrofolate reductase family protein [Candidatus Opimibacter skivensis]